jgi:2,3-bisphosphoglycerate-dependent phosphoglycerate mutase
MPTLVLLRHGRSDWNDRNLFTGWVDADLSPVGEAEGAAAGRLLADEGVLPDVVHTSVLTRAIRTANLALDACGRSWVPARRTWRLNERHYGALQGLDKAETLTRHGEEQFMTWRRSYDVPPPPIEAGSEFDVAGDPRYADLPPEVIPQTECLADVLARMLPWWADAAAPDLRAGRVVLVAAHGNSLRALVKHLDGLTEEEVVALNIVTGVPRLYELGDDLRPTRPAKDLGDPEELARRAAEVANQGKAATAQAEVDVEPEPPGGGEPDDPNADPES